LKGSAAAALRAGANNSIVIVTCLLAPLWYSHIISNGYQRRHSIE